MSAGAGLDAFEKRLLPGIEPQFIGRPAVPSQYTDSVVADIIAHFQQHASRHHIAPVQQYDAACFGQTARIQNIKCF